MASFFIGKNTEIFDQVMSAETLLRAAPDYYAPRFDAIKEMREQDDGTGYAKQEFRRVASFVNVPLFLATKVANPDFLKDKRKFYAFIDRHPEYVAYQRRGRHGRAEAAKQAMPLSVLGIDYPGGPETAENWDAVDVPLEPAGEVLAGPTTESEAST